MNPVKFGTLPLNKPVRIAANHDFENWEVVVVRERPDVDMYDGICSCGCTVWAPTCKLEVALLGLPQKI